MSDESGERLHNQSDESGERFHNQCYWQLSVTISHKNCSPNRQCCFSLFPDAGQLLYFLVYAYKSDAFCRGFHSIVPMFSGDQFSAEVQWFKHIKCQRQIMLWRPARLFFTIFWRFWAIGPMDLKNQWIFSFIDSITSTSDTGGNKMIPKCNFVNANLTWDLWGDELKMWFMVYTVIKKCWINEENSCSWGCPGRYLLNEPGGQNMCWTLINWNQLCKLISKQPGFPLSIHRGKGKKLI